MFRCMVLALMCVAICSSSDAQEKAASRMELVDGDVLHDEHLGDGVYEIVVTAECFGGSKCWKLKGKNLKGLEMGDWVQLCVYKETESPYWGRIRCLGIHERGRTLDRKIQEKEKEKKAIKSEHKKKEPEDWEMIGGPS